MDSVNFDFITDDEFRSVLVTDYEEMQTCANSEAWKSTLVLAGSVVEAVITYYLSVEGHLSREKATKLELGPAIELGWQHGILSEEFRNLSIVVKDYRNLVHPGREIRLKTKANGDTAKIAMSLVNLICDHLNDRKGSRGYTAEQVVGKARRDTFASGILRHVLAKDVNKEEIRRLLTKLVPEAYREEQERIEIYEFETEQEASHDVLSELKSLYRFSYEQADTHLREEVAREFVKILKESDSNTIMIHINNFWRMGQLEHLCHDDRETVKNYVFERLRRESSKELIQNLTGISKFLGKDTPIWRYLLVHIRCHGDKDASNAARRILREEEWEMDEEGKSLLLEYLNNLNHYYKERGSSRLVEIVEEERGFLEVPI